MTLQHEAYSKDIIVLTGLLQKEDDHPFDEVTYYLQRGNTESISEGNRLTLRIRQYYQLHLKQLYERKIGNKKDTLEEDPSKLVFPAGLEQSMIERVCDVSMYKIPMRDSNILERILQSWLDNGFYCLSIELVSDAKRKLRFNFKSYVDTSVYQAIITQPNSVVLANLDEIQQFCEKNNILITQKNPKKVI